MVKGTGTGTIVNDDFPVVSVGPTSVAEGNSGTGYAVFTINLSGASAQTVTVNYATSDVVQVAGPSKMRPRASITRQRAG